jgi:hypothetical protein
MGVIIKTYFTSQPMLIEIKAYETLNYSVYF